MMWYGIVAFIILLSDRVTKLWALAACENTYDINSWLSCSLAFNRGISWSLFHSELSFNFSVVTLLVLMVTGLVMWHAWQALKEGSTIFGETLVIAGALSNVYDRFMYGGVIDFIALEYGGYHWPLFNIADVAIVCGVMIMMYKVFRS